MNRQAKLLIDAVDLTFCPPLSDFLSVPLNLEIWIVCQLKCTCGPIEKRQRPSKLFWVETRALNTNQTISVGQTTLKDSDRSDNGRDHRN